MAKTNKGWSDADVRRAEAAARAAYAKLGLRHPTEFEIETLAYELGALVRYIPMSGAVGRLTRLGNEAIISVSDGVAHSGRRRWTVAHELGHFALHTGTDQFQLLDDVSLEEHYDQGIEREANAFASEFLMPQELWTKHADVLKPDLDIVRELAKNYQVSVQGAAIRFAKLCPERCAVVFAKGGRIEWFALGPDFGHWIQKGQKLDPYTLAFDYFAKKREPSRRESVSASAWLADDRVPDGELVEDCIVLPSLEATLSLLWIPASGEL